MNNLISKPSLAVLALLISCSGFAAQVDVIVSNTAGGKFAYDQIVAGDTFRMDVFGSGFPTGTTTTGTTGFTLGLVFPTSAIPFAPTSTALLTVPGTSPFTGGTTVANSFTSGGLVGLSGPLTGSNPGGNFGGFAAVALNFTAGAGFAAPPPGVHGLNFGGIAFVDDQGDKCWTDAESFGCVGNMTYDYYQPVPLPAAAWLIAPAFGLLAPWVKRRQATA